MLLPKRYKLIFFYGIRNREGISEYQKTISTATKLNLVRLNENKRGGYKYAVSSVRNNCNITISNSSDVQYKI